MQALSSKPEEGLVYLKADLWGFFHPDTCGIPSIWQPREEGDPFISHSRQVLWLAKILGKGHESSPGSEFTAACAAAVNQSSYHPSRKGGPSDLQAWAAQKTCHIA